MQKKIVTAGLVCLVTWLIVATARGQSKPDKRLEESALIVNAILQAPDRGVPQQFLHDAVCLGIIPSEKKLAFAVGASYGRGALVCRTHGNGPWGAPSMIRLGGASYGLQIGGEATDVLFIVIGPRAAEKLTGESLKLGADISAAAGPVGRTAEGATNAHFNAGLLSYSRARGLFAGASLSGAILKEDTKANRQLYHRNLRPEEILFSGTVPPPGSAKALDGVLEKYSPHGGAPLPKRTSS
jgi:lipid-binding SYLF domain-containing protein